ncbi:MAG: hypothetical protein ACO2Z9_05270 [Crocinitomicaceae bacterium]
MRTLLILLIITSFTAGCKKGKSDFVLRGTISDATFSQPLSGGTVKLYEVEAGGGNQTLLETATIGNDGSYSFTFPRNKVENYILTIEKENYFKNQTVIPFNDMTIKDDNIKDLSTTAKSWAKITLFNTNPQQSDHLAIIKQQGKDNCEECCSSSQVDFYGTIDTSFYCANDGNTTYQFFYQLVGTSIQGLKSDVTTAFDTTEITLQY